MLLKEKILRVRAVIIIVVLLGSIGTCARAMIMCVFKCELFKSFVRVRVCVCVKRRARSSSSSSGKRNFDFDDFWKIRVFCLFKKI